MAHPAALLTTLVVCEDDTRRYRSRGRGGRMGRRMQFLAHPLRRCASVQGVLWACALLLPIATISAATEPTPPFVPTATPTVRPRTDVYARLPLAFEANRGQADDTVRFIARAPGHSIFLMSTEAMMTFSHGRRTSATVRMRLIGANPASAITGIEKLPGRINYFIGSDPTRWRTGVPTYARVRYEGVYPGIDLVYYGNGHHLEYDFIVGPGSDPTVISLELSGVDRLHLDAAGDLVLALSTGEVRIRKPLIYQNREGHREPVAGGWLITSSFEVRFFIGSYDPALALVIDPTLDYS